ncbi:MAG: hypothetical protein AB200_02390 [Parcubacteria bacterium C7867-005]|nr:MAG: hypothetical protein AB200_02390 [Parcubacteria bacterium C7867-005]
MDPLKEYSLSPEETSPGSPLKQIRTYQGDVAEALGKQNESVSSIQRKEVLREERSNLEQKQKEAEMVSVPPAPKEIFTTPVPLENTYAAPSVPLAKYSSAPRIDREKKDHSGIMLFIGTVLLLLLGGAGSWFAYREYKDKLATPAVVVVPNKFLATNSLIDIDVLKFNRESFIDRIVEEKSYTGSSGIKQIELRKGGEINSPLLETEGFLILLRSRAPKNLVRAFNHSFMFGVLGGERPSTFMLVKLDSFENAFPGMLSWEENLLDDVLPLFASIETVSSLPSESKFQDITIQNKDARVLRNLLGRTVLLYAFFDNNLLIITDDEASLRTLINRLNAEKLSR